MYEMDLPDLCGFMWRAAYPGPKIPTPWPPPYQGGVRNFIHQIKAIFSTSPFSNEVEIRVEKIALLWTVKNTISPWYDGD